MIMIWNKYWKLTVLKQWEKWKQYLLCLCDCWNKKEIRKDHLKWWKTKTCTKCRTNPNKLHIQEWDTFNRLTILKEVTIKWKMRTFKCKCICWNISYVWIWDLRNWNIKSCWCYNLEKITKHWYCTRAKRERIYVIWEDMKQRCYNSNNTSYKYYWKRWIKVLWKKFEDFRDDMEKSYLEHCKWKWEKNTTIDRIDVNWNYCKENCRWADYIIQSNNKR